MGCPRVVVLAWLAAVSSRRIIDTHVHNADLSLGLGYTFPKSFPDLNKSWTMADYVSHPGVSNISRSRRMITKLPYLFRLYTWRDLHTLHEISG